MSSLICPRAVSDFDLPEVGFDGVLKVVDVDELNVKLVVEVVYLQEVSLVVCRAATSMRRCLSSLNSSRQERMSPSRHCILFESCATSVVTMGEKFR